MPIYEEKLISPLAIRFTQNRIRSTFKDGREIEATIKELKSSPGVDEHDIIIEAPFPAIEIIRWAPNSRKGGGEKHWFTFDNRRLYCLQRFAVECWPRRVAAKVEVMYADSGGLRKKLDTQTQGASVFIGHAFATGDELMEWSWRKAVQARAPPGVFALECEAYVANDDAKSSLCDLTDVPKRRLFPTASTLVPEAVASNDSSEQFGKIPTAEDKDDQSNTSSVEGDSLTSLIGKLLTIKDDRCTKSGSFVSSASTYFSESTGGEAGESDDGDSSISLHDAPPLESHSKEIIAKHSNAVPQQAWPGYATANEAQLLMAQYRMSQWQMAYAAQTARWHQATYALYSPHATY